MDEKFIVAKSNNLITARYDLTLEEQRIILVIISMIQPQDEQINIIRIPIKDFLNLLKIRDNKKYLELPKITKGLISKIVEIKSIDENGDKFVLQASWLTSAEYRNGILELEIGQKLKPYLLELKNFYTTYKLKNVLLFKSKYSIRVYELLKANQFKKFFTISIDELRKMLRLEDTYKSIYDLKRRILNVAKKEIDKKSDIRFNYEEIKIVGKSNKIRFFVYPNNTEFLKFTDDELYELKDRIRYLTKSEISLSILTELINLKGIEKISYYLSNYHKFKVDKHNPLGFLIKAIKEEYSIPEEEKNSHHSKPIQSTNFEQRVYDDDFFESLYDNFRNDK